MGRLAGMREVYRERQIMTLGLLGILIRPHEVSAPG